MLLPFQTGLYHDQRNYKSLTKTKAPPLPSTSTYQPRVGPPDSAVFPPLYTQADVAKGHSQFYWIFISVTNLLYYCNKWYCLCHKSIKAKRAL